MSNKPTFHFFSKLSKDDTVFDIPLGIDLLIKVTKKLDLCNIPYHLEGGTLLGIVRDNKILPWDDDLDISVPFQYEQQVKKAMRFLMLDGWRIDSRKYYKFENFPYQGARVLKFRDRSRGLFNMGHCYLDIFFKYQDDEFAYWQAYKNLLRIDAKYYDGYDEISFMGHTFKAPKNHKQYLTDKFGDWSIPIKDWDSSVDEKTIIK